MNAIQKQERYEEKKKKWNQAYDRAVGSMSVFNYGIIIRGFMAKGIPEEDIRPRENVFTYAAWKAQGRYVKKGEKGVHVVTFTEVKEKQEKKYDDMENEIPQDKAKSFRVPSGAVVFHISQTAEMAVN